MPTSPHRFEGDKVVEVLSDVHSRQIPLQVEVGRRPPPCLTRVHSVGLDPPCLEIETFGIPAVDERVQPGAAMEVMMVVDATPLRFETECVRADPFHPGLALPERIEVLQRRAHFRASAPRAEAARLEVRLSPDEAFHAARVVDLSAGGMQLEDSELASAPEEGHAIDLRVTFGEGEDLELKAVVWHTCADPDGADGAKLGVEFKDLSPQAAATLGHVARRWQNEAGQ